jgi:hypothetical protein
LERGDESVVEGRREVEVGDDDAAVGAVGGSIKGSRVDALELKKTDECKSKFHIYGTHI